MDREDTLFELGDRLYPVQTDAEPNEKFAGEYRGFYPTDSMGNGNWKPKSSRFKGRSKGRHNGVDIYTGFARFPRETPMLAAASGTLIHLRDDQAPDDLGNRAELTTTSGKEKVIFQHGHFARIHGPPRKVTKGDVIGFSGCSGNANTLGECTTPEECNITSCHVHLSEWMNTISGSNSVNPPKVLGCELDFASVNSETNCSAWKGKPSVPPDNPRAESTLNAATLDEWRRSRRNRRVPPPEPFDHVHFDDTKFIRSAVRAYENLRLRCQSTEMNRTKDKVVEFGKSLRAAMRDGWIAERKEIQDLLSDVDKEIELLKDSDKQNWLGGLTTRSVMVLLQIGWRLTGEIIIHHAMSNRRLLEDWYLLIKNSKGKLIAPSIGGKRRRRSKNPLNSLWNDALPDCGMGIGGQAHMIAAEKSVAVHHVAALSADWTALVSLNFDVVKRPLLPSNPSCFSQLRLQENKSVDSDRRLSAARSGWNQILLRAGWI